MGTRNCILVCENKTGGDVYYWSEGVHFGQRKFRTKRRIADGKTFRYIGGHAGRVHIKYDRGFYNIGYEFPVCGSYKCLVR